MLRRWIPSICVSMLAVLGLVLVAETAAAGPFQRLRDRRSNRGSEETTAVSDQSVSGTVQSQQQQQPQAYVQNGSRKTVTSQPVVPASYAQPQQQPSAGASQPQLLPQEYIQSGSRRQMRRGTSSWVPASWQPVEQVAFAQPQQQPSVNFSQPQQEEYLSGTRRQIRRGRGTVVYSSYEQPQTQQAQAQQPQQFQVQQTGYRSYYRVPTPDAPAGTVLLNVRVPANAQVTIDGDKTQQTGAFRQFVSPQLEQGKNYVYQVRAEWSNNGRKVIRNRKVMVQAGQAVDIDLTRPTQQELREQNPNQGN